MNISIIVPVYNVEKYIKKCILSIINQTYTNSVECIIVNDATPDNSINIIQEIISGYQGSIIFKIINHSKNRGLAAARNTGLSQALGKYILNIDGDDYCEPELLEELSKKINENNADIIGFDYYKDFGSHKIRDGRFKFKTSVMYNLESLMNCNYTANVWRRLIKRSLYIENNVHPIEGINMAEDVMVTIQLHYYAKTVDYIDKPLYNYIQYNNSSLVHNISTQKINETFKAYKFIENFLKEKDAFEAYKLGFYKRCIFVKLPFLLNKKIRSYKQWLFYYPESTKYLNQMDLSWNFKLFIRLINNKIIRNILLYIYDLKSKINE